MAHRPISVSVYSKQLNQASKSQVGHLLTALPEWVAKCDHLQLLFALRDLVFMAWYEKVGSSLVVQFKS